MAKMILTNGYYGAEKGSWNWLTEGNNKFKDNTNIAFWFADLSALTNGYEMFKSCTNLISFSSDLSALTNGYNMFSYCTNLTSFEGDLSALTDGSMIFQGCTNLTSFEADLSALTNGIYMFQGCKNLTSFEADLSSLADGRYMFGDSTSDCTRLDLASVQNIANTINDLKAAGKTGTIHIGMQKAIQGNADLETALAAIRAKGWTVNEMYRV